MRGEKPSLFDGKLSLFVYKTRPHGCAVVQPPVSLINCEGLSAAGAFIPVLY